MTAFDNEALPVTRFYRDVLLPLIQNDSETLNEVRGILNREFTETKAVWEMSEPQLKRFNGRVITVLRQRGLMQPPFGERPRPAPMQFVVAPGGTIKPGDRVVQDARTGKLRKAEPRDFGGFTVPPGARLNTRGFLEFPL